VELAVQAEPRIEIGLRTRVVRARVRLAGGADALRPGMQVDIEGEGVVAASALVAPGDAILFREDSNVVFVIEEGRARLRQVRLGYVTYALAEITAGLKEGDLVVVAGKDGLVEGQRVRVRRIREY
jgi:multidrug efflux pump subunit AcrA (membrane-fusion protein)